LQNDLQTTRGFEQVFRKMIAANTIKDSGLKRSEETKILMTTDPWSDRLNTLSNFSKCTTMSQGDAAAVDGRSAGRRPKTSKQWTFRRLPEAPHSHIDVCVSNG
jgi:hypothetical protein